MSTLSRDDTSSAARSAPAGASARRRLAPKPSPILLALLAVAAIQALAWAIVLPPLEGPDEISHFAYTERMVETRSIPFYPGGTPSNPGHSISTELNAAAIYGGILAESRNPFARPPGSQRSVELWRRQPSRTNHADRADGGYASAMGSPPLYYLYAALPYLATYPLDFFDREFAMRLANIPLLLAIVALTWAIAGHAAAAGDRCRSSPPPRSRSTPSSRISPRSSIPTCSWRRCGRRSSTSPILVVMRGATRGASAGIVVLCVASCLTHGRGIAILVPAALVLALRVVALAPTEQARRRAPSLVPPAWWRWPPATWCCGTRRWARRT